jgi:hypothetical protein
VAGTAHCQMDITGGCLCGKTRYSVAAELYSLNNCHCVDCRRSSGAPFVTWGSTQATALKLIEGSVRKVPHAGRIRSFASCCGTPLFFEEKLEAPEVDIAIASLDQPQPFPPASNIWTEDRLPWVVLDPAIPAFPQSARRTLNLLPEL